MVIEISAKTVEMEQFRVINGTAKAVRTDLVNAILASIAEAEGPDVVPEKDMWKVVVTKVVDMLNQKDDSPWKSVLLMPDEVGVKDAPNKIIRATSAITSIKIVHDWLKEFGFLAGRGMNDQAEVVTDVLVAYWRGVRNVVPDAFVEPGQYVIQKTPGLFSLHYLLRDNLLGNIYRGRRSWDEATFQEFIQNSPEIIDPHFWHKDSGRASSYGSMKGFRELADLLGASVTPD